MVLQGGICYLEDCICYILMGELSVDILWLPVVVVKGLLVDINIILAKGCDDNPV